MKEIIKKEQHWKQYFRLEKKQHSQENMGGEKMELKLLTHKPGLRAQTARTSKNDTLH